MNTIDRYIGRQVLVSSIFAVLVLSVVLILGNVFKHILTQLVERPDMDLGFVAKFMLYVLPFSLSLTIPWGFLTAILLIFGRLSADNELISLRMAGLSMPRICMSVGVVAILFTGLCAWMNISVSPSAKNKMVRMLPDMIFNMAAEDPMSLFTDRQVMDEIPSHLIWAEKSEDGESLINVQMVKMDNRMRPETFVIAKHVDVRTELGGDKPAMILEMHDALFELKSDPDPKKFTEAQPYLAEFAPLDVPLDRLQEKSDKFRPETMPFASLFDALKSGELDRGKTSSVKTEISMRMSFSMACITLGMIGIPLGITAQRRETSIGFAISLIVGIVYFLLIVIADIMRENDSVYPQFLVWLPNLLFLALGVFLFRRLART